MRKVESVHISLPQVSLTILLNITIITLLPDYITFFNLLGVDLRIIDPMNHTDLGVGCCKSTFGGSRMLAEYQTNRFVFSVSFGGGGKW